MIIVPDLHGEYKEFIELISMHTEIKDGLVSDHILFLGDLVDKGDIEGQVAILEFFWKNKNNITFIRGNHDEKAWRQFKGENLHFSDKYTNHFAALATKEQKELFLNVYALSVPFVEFNKFQACHSPCLVEHIENRTKEMTKYSFASESDFDSRREYALYLRKFFLELISSQPDKLTFFGHLEVSRPVIVGKQIWLDTRGANKLTIAVLDDKLKFFDLKGSVNPVFVPNDDPKYILKMIPGISSYN
jgi:hypothetical protein